VYLHREENCTGCVRPRAAACPLAGEAGSEPVLGDGFFGSEGTRGSPSEKGTAKESPSH